MKFLITVGAVGITPAAQTAWGYDEFLRHAGVSGVSPGHDAGDRREDGDQRGHLPRGRLRPSTRLGAGAPADPRPMANSTARPSHGKAARSSSRRWSAAATPTTRSDSSPSGTTSTSPPTTASTGSKFSTQLRRLRDVLDRPPDPRPARRERRPGADPSHTQLADRSLRLVRLPVTATRRPPALPGRLRRLPADRRRTPPPRPSRRTAGTAPSTLVGRYRPGNHDGPDRLRHLP